MANAIFIVGYYRSGTSALSGALQCAGVKFYNEAAANEHNPLGFFEIPELIEFDARLFRHLGADWPDLRGLPDGWLDRTDITPFATQLEDIIRRRFLPQDRLWGLKHPHLCRTLPLYERVARRAGHTPHVVHIFRDPWVAVASQCYKNGLSRAHALLLWLCYTTNAEHLTRHLPRTWLTYHALLDDPVAQLKQIEAALGLTIQPSGHDDGFAQASTYLTNQLDRSKKLPNDSLFQPLEDLVNRTWEAIQNRQFMPTLWDGLAVETNDLVGFLSEIGSSKAQALPSFGAPFMQTDDSLTARTPTRPLERLDEATHQGLTRLREAAAPLPRIAIIVAAPAGRAHAVAETLASLHAQWEPPAHITVLTVEPLTLEDIPTFMVGAEAEAMTKTLCLHLNQDTITADYVAILNAGDVIAPDACLRFALLAAQTKADILYSDEIVPDAGTGWIRYKPNWDITRLRQAAYIGDWVWYNRKAIQAAGGFDPAMAGAEEYDLQLRLAERNARVTRLTEVVFTRSGSSRRDHIGPDVFCGRAATALSNHLARVGQPADVQNRHHPGLFYHTRLIADPGTTIIMLCDGADIPALDKWLTILLTEQSLTAPVILAGADISAAMRTYLATVTERQEALLGQVLAVTAASQSEAIAQALTLIQTPLVMFLDARMQDVSAHWQAQLRSRLADQSAVAVAARTITPMSADGRQGQVMGPIILGANTRMGAGHGPLDPGPGGWLVVDQEASAIAPPGLLVRRKALANCHISPSLQGDTLWIDLCAQLRAGGGRLVWTPDVSFVMPPVIEIDSQSNFRTLSPAARALPWADPYHHPALSLHDDLLIAEKRIGLVQAAPPDPDSLLLTGDVAWAGPVLNAGRALRQMGIVAADWAPGSPSVADINRRAPQSWVRINPSSPPDSTAIPHMTVYTTTPCPTAPATTLTHSTRIFATSPALVAHLHTLVPDKPPVELWRPALSGQVWQNFKPGTGLNTKPRVLWVDEGMAPPWFKDLITETQDLAAWMIIGQPDVSYEKGPTILPHPQTEQGWSELCALAGPQILLRPTNTNIHADCYTLLLAAAVGCRLMVDHRLDTPKELEALLLPNKKQAWLRALGVAIADLNATLKCGARSRTAALALPTLEQTRPPWACLAASF